MDIVDFNIKKNDIPVVYRNEVNPSMTSRLLVLDVLWMYMCDFLF